MESLFPGCVEEPLLEHLFAGVLGQLEVVDTRVDRRVDVDRLGVLSHHSQPRVEVSQTTWREGATARHKLDECLRKREGGREGGRERERERE